MTRTEELVGRLRRIAWGGYMHKKTTIQAADMIEEQAAEIERMQQAIWQALDDMGDGYCVCPAAKDQMREVLASIEGRSHD